MRSRRTELRGARRAPDCVDTRWNVMGAYRARGGCALSLGSRTQRPPELHAFSSRRPSWFQTGSSSGTRSNPSQSNTVRRDGARTKHTGNGWCQRTPSRRFLRLDNKRSSLVRHPVGTNRRRNKRLQVACLYFPCKRRKRTLWMRTSSSSRTRRRTADRRCCKARSNSSYPARSERNRFRRRSPANPWESGIPRALDCRKCTSLDPRPCSDFPEDSPHPIYTPKRVRRGTRPPNTPPQRHSVRHSSDRSRIPPWQGTFPLPAFSDGKHCLRNSDPRYRSTRDKARCRPRREQVFPPRTRTSPVWRSSSAPCRFAHAIDWKRTHPQNNSRPLCTLGCRYRGSTRRSRTRSRRNTTRTTRDPPHYRAAAARAGRMTTFHNH